MFRLNLKIIVCFFVVFIGTAQTKKLTLESIWSGSFVTDGLDDLYALKDGKHYTVLNFDNAARATTIDVYNYLTQKKTNTLLSSKSLSELRYFSSYKFSKDESKILLATNEVSVYRHSTLGNYYVYNREDKRLIAVSKNKIQEPTLSPDGNKVAYVYNNNLYVKNLVSGKTQQITMDGGKNKIINGITDWVYEEEFGFVRAFDWNLDSNQIAFLKFNETEVAQFSIGMYGNTLYPAYQNYKYPKAGTTNSKVTLHIYNINTNATQSVNTLNAYYIPRLQWTKSSNVLSVQVLNRAQNNLKLYTVNSKSLALNLILEEKDKAYAEVTDYLTFLDDNSFLWTSEKSGYNHIYHYSKKGELINQITQGRWDVTNYYGFNAAKNTLYYQAVETGSINRAIYSVKLNAKDKKLLSSKTGTNVGLFNADFSMFINTFSSATTPPVYTLNSAITGKKILDVKDNNALLKKILPYNLSKKEFTTLLVNGNQLNAWFIKPPNFNPKKKYPLLMHQYSGPGSQEVSNTWHTFNDYWFQYLAQQGFVIACVDGRGTGYKGANFKKMTQNKLGELEVQDQIAAAKILATKPYIDASRIGIWGWSYGGFVSSNCLFKAPNVFKAAIAVAPVSSWRFYDTIYTERYLGLPQDNAKGYDDNSPINYVNNLKGDFLLVHGSADDNVHLQNTLVLAEALIQANKDFDWAIYPDKNHGIYGGNTRLHLYRKMTRFIVDKLGDKQE